MPPPRPTPAAGAGRSPRSALAELLAGNRRFVSGQPVHGHDVTAAAAVASGDQQPYAVVLGCIDSRVPLEAIFDQTFGSICVIRTGAHVLDRAVLGSIEYVVGQLGVPLVMVLGHERCGAVGSAVETLRTGERPGGSLAYVVDQIAPAVAEVGPDDPRAHPLAVRRHVRRTVAALRADDLLAGPVAAGRVAVVGALYDLATGDVALLAEGPAGETTNRPPG
ncbi:carbonic anhydrase [Micromonospora kangleipakensis]|uniref:Carbonic anhydrase n=1 Tax=Micromonospora kangleipakensis TaxID=1077942 RepID=A0A4Q8BIS6_9ACTN|nr:carbonic anhydrase [Micromonospora kangleipakensis]RZU77451.1 carbonic anhydrase [Micromonospora kangleipakensis]